FRGEPVARERARQQPAARKALEVQIRGRNHVLGGSWYPYITKGVFSDESCEVVNSGGCADRGACSALVRADAAAAGHASDASGPAARAPAARRSAAGGPEAGRADAARAVPAGR